MILLYIVQNAIQKRPKSELMIWYQSVFNQTCETLFSWLNNDTSLSRSRNRASLSCLSRNLFGVRFEIDFSWKSKSFDCLLFWVFCRLVISSLRFPLLLRDLDLVFIEINSSSICCNWYCFCNYWLLFDDCFSMILARCKLLLCDLVRCSVICFVALYTFV